MKKTIKYVVFLSATLAGVMLTGCDNKLDIQPVNNLDAIQAVKTSSDVQALLVGAYDALGDGDVYGGNLLRDAELLGDTGDVFWNGTFVAPDEIFAKRLLVNNDQAASTWLDSYAAVNIANNVLANLGVVAESDKARVEGEARFIRGVVFFELVRMYAPAWTAGNPTASLGIPLVLTPTTIISEVNKVKRNTVAEVYTQVIADLTSAESLLPASNGFFATKSAASAMLMRVYMMQGRYADAAAAADKVIESGDFELLEDYAAVFNQGTNTNEDVFAVQVTSQDGINNMNTFFGAPLVTGRGDIPVESQHFDLYEEKDVRRYFFYDEEGNQFTGDVEEAEGFLFTSKWRNQFGNVNIIRLAEVYLTRAEANFRNNTAIGDTPLNDINAIRTRAGVDPLTTVTLEQILLERRKELAFEGHLIHDLKRTRQSVGSLPYNSPRLVFPIPQRERDINPALEQNAGY